MGRRSLRFRAKRRIRGSRIGITKAPVLFSRTIVSADLNVTTSTTGYTYSENNIKFSLQDATGSATTYNFDNYKIVGVQVKAVPSWNQALSTTNPVPRIYISFDSDNAQTIGITGIRERADCKFYSLYKPISVFCKPKPVGGVQPNTGNTTTPAMIYRNAPWLDTAAPNIAHFGYRCVVETPPTPNGVQTFTITFIRRYYLKWRQPIVYAA